MLQEKVTEVLSFPGTLKVHQVTGNIFLPKKNRMKSLSCFCNPDGCDHYNLGVINYKKEALLEVSTIFSESEDEEKIEKKIEEKRNQSDPENPSTSYEGYKIGDYLLIKFRQNKSKTEYRYAGICSDFDEAEEELRITFLKLFDYSGTVFTLNEKDVADVRFDEVVEKLPVPNNYFKNKTQFYEFTSAINVYEKR